MIAGIFLGALIASVIWIIVALVINERWYKDSLKLNHEWSDFCMKINNGWYNEFITKEGESANNE